MLAYSTTQSRAPGPTRAQAQFSAPKPAGNTNFLPTNSFSNHPADQQPQASFAPFSQAQAQPSIRPQFGQVASAQSYPPSAFAPQSFQPAASNPQFQFQNPAQPSAASALPVFQGFYTSSSQVAQAAPFNFQPQPATAVAASTIPFAPQQQRVPPRPDMPAKLAAAVSPALSLNCRQGHGLICISGKPARYADWFCDLCQQRMPHDTKHVMHCHQCASDGPVAPAAASGFDMCPACRGKARDAMSIWPLILNAAACPMFPGVGDYWQTLYCHRQHAPCLSPPTYYSLCGPPPPRTLSLAPCGPREGAQCLDCKRGQDALVASVEGRLLNRGGRAVSHVCYGAGAGMYFCGECDGGGQQCADCKFTQENLPDIK